MVITCPRDGTELNPGTWSGCTFDLLNERSTYTWDRCEGTPAGLPGHRVTVVWIGRKPEVVVTDIVAVPLGRSQMMNRGLSLSPFVPKPGVRKMVIVKVPKKS